VLYLPASENLEFSGYVEKGVQPNLMIGAEHDENEYPTVFENSNGIHLVQGSVCQAVDYLIKHRLPRLVSANIDLDGNYNTFAHDIVSIFRVLPNPDHGCGYLAVTSYAARDHGLAQGVLNVSKFCSGLEISDLEFSRGWRSMIDYYAVLGRHLPGYDAREYTHLAREFGLLWWLVVGMASVNIPNSYTYAEANQLFVKGEISQVLSQITRQALDLDRGTEFYKLRDRRLTLLLGKRHTQLWPTEMCRIMYYTLNHQPMQTWFFKIWEVDKETKTVRQLLRQMWELAVRTPLTFVSDTGIPITIGKEQG